MEITALTPEIDYRVELQDASGDWFFIEKTSDLANAQAYAAYWKRNRPEHQAYPERIVRVKKWRHEEVLP